MAETNTQPDFLTELGRELTAVWTTLRAESQQMGVAIRNQLRQARGAKLDYIIMPLGGSLPERADPPRGFIERQLPLPPAPLSLEQLNRRLQAVADADNVKGVLFLFRGFQLGLAQLQNFRRAIERLRATGKEVIVFTPYLNLPHYYAASAASKIIVPPSAQFDVLGLQSEVSFYKDALARIGVEVDVVQISPFKTAFDSFGKSEMTPEFKAQVDWLLDDQFAMLTSDMAADRGLELAELQQWIDRAPLTAAAALAAGLVDAVAYEDELAAALFVAEEEKEEAPGDEPDDEEAKNQAKLLPWDEAAPLLTEKWRKPSQKLIGVVSLEGVITMGPSRQPPLDLPIPFLGGESAGEATLVQLLRQAEQMDNLAALILHVDSGGGSALASDLIGREVKRVAQKIPVLAYMGNAAASGGYYVSAPASHIMSQRGTMTGSIGVIMARPSTGGLYEKLSVNRVTVKRGERADLYSDVAPMTAEERQVFWDGIMENYNQFKQEVANGRSLPFDELDPICEGRVWTGRQARERKLVDSHGDFVDAIHQAAELAGLPHDNGQRLRVVNLWPERDGYLPPKPFAAAEEIGRWVFGERLRDLSGQPLFLLPFQVQLW
ncbi:MAG: signal peptide peptidase SppA [Ardenticatenaceae bacterium]|nr:signal peptide peptidase SppA [Ardenticatenaceae bacterium]